MYVNLQGCSVLTTFSEQLYHKVIYLLSFVLVYAVSAVTSKNLLFFPSFSRTIITSILDISTYNSKMEKHAFPIQEFRIKRFILTIQLHVDFLIVQIWIIWQVSEVWNKVQILSFYTFVRRCDGTKLDVLGILRDQLDKYSVILLSALITEYTYQNCR